jgi:hypothetical protein
MEPDNITKEIYGLCIDRRRSIELQKLRSVRQKNRTDRKAQMLMVIVIKTSGSTGMDVYRSGQEAQLKWRRGNNICRNKYGSLITIYYV